MSKNQFNEHLKSLVFKVDNWGTIAVEPGLRMIGNWHVSQSMIWITVNILYLACTIFGGISIFGYLAWIWIGILF